MSRPLETRALPSRALLVSLASRLTQSSIGSIQTLAREALNEMFRRNATGAP
jgi:hypothetical protein